MFVNICSFGQSIFLLIFNCLFPFFQREYEEFKIRINGLVSKAQKVPEEGWIMQDGTPWPGNNTRDHPGMIQVCLNNQSEIIYMTNDFDNHPNP